MSPELSDAVSALSAWLGACLVFGWVAWVLWGVADRATDPRKWSRDQRKG